MPTGSSMDEFEHDTHEDKRGQEKPPVPRVKSTSSSIDKPELVTEEQKAELRRAKRAGMGEDPDREWLRDDNPYVWDGDVSDLFED